jgi:hypothetical protein
MQAALVTIARQRVIINISSAKESLSQRSHPSAILVLQLSFIKGRGGEKHQNPAPLSSLTPHDKGIK